MNKLVAKSVRLENTQDPSYRFSQQGGAWYNNAGDFVRGVKQANKFAKDNKVISKIKGVTDVLGVTPQLDTLTAGLYSKGAKMGRQAGYGKKKMQRGKGKGKK